MQYAHFYLAFLSRLEPVLTGDTHAPAIEQIQAELDNVRTAWRWSVDQGKLGLLEMGLEGLQWFYRLAGIYPEAIQLLEAALPSIRQTVALAPASPQPQRLLTRLLCYTIRFYRVSRRLGELKKCEAWANEALTLSHRLADPVLQGLACYELARLADLRGDYGAMRLHSEQACAYGRQANLPHFVAENLNNLGIAVSVSVHPLAGIPHFHEALDALYQQANRALEIPIIGNLGLFYLAGHEYQAASGYLQQQGTSRHRLRYRETGLLALINLGDLWTRLGAYNSAQQEYEQGLALVQTQPIPYWECWLQVSYGRLQHLCGDLVTAQSAYRLALQFEQKSASHFAVWASINLGHVFADLGDLGAASHCYQQAITAVKETNWRFRLPDAYAGLAALSLAQNEVATAVQHAETALAILTQHGLAAAGEPFTVYWTCIRALQAAGAPRVQTVLATAYQQLQEIANQLEDTQLQSSFLRNVVANRNLVAAACLATIA